LQRLITEPDLVIEGKGKDIITCQNRMHILIMLEGGLVLPAGAQERRYVVFNLKEEHVQDPDYFRTLYTQLENGGYEAMLYDLLRRPLGDWHPRQIITTAGLVDQQYLNLDAFSAWWVELLQTSESGEPGTPANIAPSNEYTVSTQKGQKETKPGLFTLARKSSPKLDRVVVTRRIQHHAVRCRPLAAPLDFLEAPLFRGQ
jgi:hypothetical protein